MSGDEAERFCTQCGRSVHNLHLLSIERKLELLRQPRGNLCGRYRLAIRQAVPGREPCYFEHLLKYGAGVALVSAALITLWEVSAAADRANGVRHFRVGHGLSDGAKPMPPELYEEVAAPVLGEIICLPSPPPPRPRAGMLAPSVLEIRVDDSALQEMLRTPPPLSIPALEPPHLPRSKSASAR